MIKKKLYLGLMTLFLALVGIAFVQVSAAADTRPPDWQAGPALESQDGCVHLLGSGTTIRIAIVPWGFDPADPADVAKFEELSQTIADGFAGTPPYADNEHLYSIYRADDYRGQYVTADQVWYSPVLINAARVCDYNQIIVIGHNSGWAGGAPGFYSVVGSGTPPTCDPTTCTGQDCPWTYSCSWDANIAYTALHETGHTFVGLRHTCAVYSLDQKRLESFEKVSGWSLFDAVNDEDPINCGEQSTGNPDLPCIGWDTEVFLRWNLPQDPNFGCYAGCSGTLGWFRAWEHTDNLMCVDLYVEHGFTPVDRKLLFDALNQRNAPSFLYASAVSQDQINLTWQDNSRDETGFRIDRSRNNSTWTEIAQVAANTVAYSDTNLFCNTYYFYRIRAYWAGDDGYSRYSSNASTITLPCTPDKLAKLSPPNGAVVPRGKVTLSWLSINEAVRYEICAMEKAKYVARNACGKNNAWTSVGLNTSINRIAKGKKPVFWQVRVLLPDGTFWYANNGQWWSYTSTKKMVR